MSDQREIVVDGVRRTYVVHEPAGAARLRPLVLVFHGGSGSAEGIRALTRFDAGGDRYGFTVAYLNSLDRWSDGRVYARSSGADDVGFARAVITELAASGTIARDCVYAVGFANGGILVHRLGAELSELAGIAAVCGYMAIGVTPPVRRLRVLLIAGVEDPLMPFAGGPLVMSSAGTPTPPRGEVRSAAATARVWAQANDCRSSGETGWLAPPDATDSTRMRTIVHCDAAGTPQVTLLEIAGMGHVWPGARPATAHVGNGTTLLDATDVIAQFVMDMVR